MACDQFGLWLNNTLLLSHLNDDTLKQRQNEIISFFGGFRQMMNLCIMNQFNIHLKQHQQLFKSLSAYKTQQNIKLCKNIDKKTLIDVHPIAISIIFRFLNKRDHISLQKSCKTLTIIGRSRDSYNINAETHEYIQFGQHLTFQHKLPFIIKLIESDQHNAWKTAINILKEIADKLIDWRYFSHSGLIPSLFNLCKTSIANNNVDICQDIISLLSCYKAIKSAFMNHELLDLICNLISNYNSPQINYICCNVISKILELDSSFAISLQQKGFLSILLPNIGKLEQTEDGIVCILSVINNIIRLSPKIESESKVADIMDELVHHKLFEYAKTLKTNHSKEIESFNAIMETFEIISLKHDVSFDINDKEEISLIYFLLTQYAVTMISYHHLSENEKKLMLEPSAQYAADVWLSVDPQLFLHEDIHDFIKGKCGDNYILNVYLKRLNNTNKNASDIEKKKYIEEISNYIFKHCDADQMQTYFTAYFERNISNECIEFIKQYIAASDDSNLEIFKCLLGNDSFERMIKYELDHSPKRAFKYISEMMQSFNCDNNDNNGNNKNEIFVDGSDILATSYKKGDDIEFYEECRSKKQDVHKGKILNLRMNECGKKDIKITLKCNDGSYFCYDLDSIQIRLKSGYFVSKFNGFVLAIIFNKSIKTYITSHDLCPVHLKQIIMSSAI